MLTASHMLLKLDKSLKKKDIINVYENEMPLYLIVVVKKIR